MAVPVFVAFVEQNRLSVPVLFPGKYKNGYNGGAGYSWIKIQHESKARFLAKKIRSNRT